MTSRQSHQQARHGELGISVKKVTHIFRTAGARALDEQGLDATVSPSLDSHVLMSLRVRLLYQALLASMHSGCRLYAQGKSARRRHFVHCWVALRRSSGRMGKWLYSAMFQSYLMHLPPEGLLGLDGGLGPHRGISSTTGTQDSALRSQRSSLMWCSRSCGALLRCIQQS